jgi:hypothetical protein
MLTITKTAAKVPGIVLLAMHNPFGLLNLKLLHALIDAGNRYFVRQTYQRGLHPFDEIQKAAFLFTHYRDLRSAQMHYNFLHRDANRFLYDSRNPAHFAKLEIAARQVPAYPVYTPLLEKPWEPSEKMSVSIRRYIATHLNWRVPREETVKADLFTEFGELFVNLKYMSQEAKVPLADIEKS